ncbi:ABC transporter substrate-binding protein [Mesorhizobium sp. CO1-1-7]|uniref:ABC transporter substrate-binding protein n=1 Tax=unclassified Mesorhizobium TaxID=325217 RepID=UPI00112A36A1|nr:MULTISPECIES: ABC transporter substrate-binding protein [unclassified Mesorhizobium]MBZ9684744.1 ABC transporter substrate-binding protein [Mesorhizobium sp. CO1-1-2]MBZ9697439.1 ABC transporter substrate-binding protein [Mesorhizobium sp. CO1-1-9]MBZ9744294.1 ABC transporter substrate-binding protein [Mesorhizobium sp. CO1-1-7]MBZ9754580.1 ABC transporter substrate-binding protein [Mesorhizobium sp. ESP6-5]MBZ9924107.1 ABC transporter substrate-binding protein [Mesorhizobium sp. BR1-1-4]
MKKMLLLGVASAAFALSAPAHAELKFKPGEDKRFNWANYEDLKKVDLKGETLTIFGPWRGEDETLVRSVLDYFSEATGAEVKYSSSENYEQQIVIDTQAGSPPNIAVLPQPGLIQDLASKGVLTPLGDDVAAWVKENYAAGDSWAKLGTYNGKDGKPGFYAFPYKIDVKGLVWYSPDNFEEAGYKVPKTQEELAELEKKIIADGGKPWCIGLGSGGATGWPATDWVEDIMLRTQTPEVYDKWVKNEIPFNDPAVVNAIDIFGKIATDDKMVDGGAKAVAATDFRDSPKGLFTVPPKCYMHHQASFIPSFFPEGVKLGQDADFFPYPPYGSKPELGTPLEVAGTLVMITKDSKASREFIKFLQMPLAHELWMAQKSFVTPFKGANKDAYGSDALKKQGEILVGATTVRFDGSDLMPGKVGAGSFWTGMIDLVGGKSAQDVATDIQKSWDAIK